MLSDQQHRQIHFILLLLLVFFIPLSPRFAVLWIILLAINALVGNFPYRPFLAQIKTWPFILFGGFYVLHLLGMLYTENQIEGWRDLETKMSLLLFPILLLGQKQPDKAQREQVFMSFTAGSFLSIMLCLSLAVWVYFDTGKNTFTYSDLSSHLKFHPTYLSLYLSLALFWVIDYSWRNRKNFRPLQRILFYLLATFFLVMLVLLSARIVILAVLFILGLGYFMMMVNKGKWMQGLLTVLGGMVVFVFLLSQFPLTNSRMKKIWYSYVDPSLIPEATKEIRPKLWKSGVLAIKEAPLFGQGTGDAEPIMMRIYAEQGVQKAIEKNYNVHNQYLQTSTVLGIPGGLWLLLSFLYPLALAWKQRYYLYVAFLSLFLITLIPESVLENQQGIIFYAVFNSFMAWLLLKKQAES